MFPQISSKSIREHAANTKTNTHTHTHTHTYFAVAAVHTDTDWTKKVAVTLIGDDNAL